MKWIFAFAVLLVAASLGAYAIYTFGEGGDAETVRTVAIRTEPKVDPEMAEVRAIWDDYRAWYCAAYAKTQKNELGYEIDNRACEDAKVISITRVRRGLWRLVTKAADDSAGTNYRPSCYSVDPDAYEPPPSTATWPEYDSPGITTLSYDSCPTN